MSPIVIAVLVVLVAAVACIMYASRAAFVAARGNLEYMKGNQDKAMALLEKASRLPRVQPKHLTGYAYLLMKAGKPAEAERILNDALPKAKGLDKMQAQVNLATAMWLQGRREEAVELLERTHAEYKNTTVYGNLGYFKLLLGNDLEEALSFNLEAYGYNDNDLTILDNVAQSYYMLGRYEEAAEWYAKVVAKQPKHAESYYFYAQTLRRLGRAREALEQARTAAAKPLALVTPLSREEPEALAVDIEKSGMI
ncbi:tetratricopeptide repeat protein [Paenibacillus sp.]|uniref:tetratricopeptide repeat protein n=1 Tax=Paenibacillus sp. TaxID=58172 RepID=UPI002D75520C|nr:tetratricopeptide repeat protein [Paenibacillus sp.]HZG58261.1 tetratricopeptide repeat protein [Paenibacillus sp.]